jgi:hypothetical protein
VVYKHIETACLRCRDALTVRRSNNLTFIHCKNRNYITADYSPPKARLLAGRRVLATWSEDTRRKTAKSKVVIGNVELV